MKVLKVRRKNKIPLGAPDFKPQLQDTDIEIIFSAHSKFVFFLFVYFFLFPTPEAAVEGGEKGQFYQQYFPTAACLEIRVLFSRGLDFIAGFEPNRTCLGEFFRE